MNEKLKELAELLTHDADLYNVVTALRGPDTEHSALKRIFTIRIRYLTGLCVVLCREEKTVDFNDIIKAVLAVDTNDIHYLVHVVWALESLEKLKAIDKREAEFLYNLAKLLMDIVTNLSLIHI